MSADRMLLIRAPRTHLEARVAIIGTDGQLLNHDRFSIDHNRFNIVAMITDGLDTLRHDISRSMLSSRIPIEAQGKCTVEFPPTKRLVCARS